MTGIAILLKKAINVRILIRSSERLFSAIVRLRTLPSKYIPVNETNPTMLVVEDVACQLMKPCSKKNGQEMVS